MKNKIVGLLVFLFFILACVIMEGGSIANFFAITNILLVLGITSGLLIMYYKKGMSRDKLLRKAKQYFVFSGYYSALIAIIMVLSTVPIKELQSFEFVVRVIPTILLAILYGYAFAYITDTFIED